MKKLLLSISCILLTINCLKAQSFKLDNGQLMLPMPLNFETGSDKLTTDSDSAIGYIKRFLDEKTYISLLRIEGHLSADGNEANNQKLSEKRALAIVKALIAKGVDCKRLIAVGFGNTKPIADNATPEGKAQNRRIELRMAALRGKAIGGLPVDGGGQVSGNPCDGN